MLPSRAGRRKPPPLRIHCSRRGSFADELDRINLTFFHRPPPPFAGVPFVTDAGIVRMRPFPGNVGQHFWGTPTAESKCVLHLVPSMENTFDVIHKACSISKSSKRFLLGKNNFLTPWLHPSPKKKHPSLISSQTRRLTGRFQFRTMAAPRPRVDMIGWMFPVACCKLLSSTRVK